MFNMCSIEELVTFQEFTPLEILGEPSHLHEDLENASSNTNNNSNNNYYDNHNNNSNSNSNHTSVNDKKDLISISNSELPMNSVNSIAPVPIDSNVTPKVQLRKRKKETKKRKVKTKACVACHLDRAKCNSDRPCPRFLFCMAN